MTVYMHDVLHTVNTYGAENCMNEQPPNIASPSTILASFNDRDALQPTYTDYGQSSLGALPYYIAQCENKSIAKLYEGRDYNTVTYGYLHSNIIMEHILLQAYTISQLGNSPISIRVQPANPAYTFHLCYGIYRQVK